MPKKDKPLRYLGITVSVIIIIGFIFGLIISMVKIVSEELFIRRDIAELKINIRGMKETSVITKVKVDILYDERNKPPEGSISTLFLNRKILEEKHRLNFQVISGTQYASPPHVFLIDRFGDRKEFIPFKGESSDASWSPDMSKIVFQGKEKGKEDDNYDIYIFDLSTSLIHRRTGYSDNIHPIWMPNGKEILFCSNRFQIQTDKDKLRNEKERKRDHDLFIMNSDGSNQRVVLTRTDISKEMNLSIRLPSVSPDGKCIGFSTRIGDDWDLWIMLLSDKSSLKRISGWGYCRMRWNPANDEQVVFTKDRRHTQNWDISTATDIIIADIVIHEEKSKICIKNEFNLTKLYFEKNHPKYPYCPADNFPDFSYDGKQIIFSSVVRKKRSLEEEKWILHIISVDGTGRRKLSSKEIKAISPDW